VGRRADPDRGARKGDDLYLIPAEGDPLPPSGTAVRGAVEDDRRTALMRTHSGLHVLCGVVFRDFGALVTGGNMEPLTARMDFNLPEAAAEGFRDAVEEACNTELRADRRIDVRVLPRDEAFALPDIIRTATNLVPPEVKEVRVVDIVGLDQQADGGTHVASTSQVGRIEVVKIESKGKGFRRLRIRSATSRRRRPRRRSGPSLDPAALRAAVIRPGGLWRSVEVTEHRLDQRRPAGPRGRR
jgi:misacylated tRNA(Ala) deacylase